MVWDPQLIFLQQKLQAVEKFVLRVCLTCKSWELSCDELFVQDGIESLTFRRKIAAKVLFTYKVLYKLLHIPDDLFP